MKLRILLAVASLLLLASIAMAAPAAPVSTPAAPAAGDLSFMAPAATSPGCAAPELPFLTPAPTERTSLCGTCSTTNCRGHVAGGACSSGQQHCVVADTCSTGGFNCYCGIA